MSRLDVLLTGDAILAAEIIKQDMPTSRDEILLELRCGLVNALRRIERLEIAALEAKIVAENGGLRT